jgi:hypothetical protein
MDWLDVIGWTGSAVLVWSLLQARVIRLRALNLLGGVVLIGYNAALGVWPMVGLNVVISVINVWYLARMLATRHDTGTYEVVQVRPDDAFLGHVLRVHATDIARFNPGFRPEVQPDRCAFLVVRADEVVGVVLVRDAGSGVAQVELDYVTQRFRDLTPGEFVYRRSSLFTDLGFRTVVSPPGMLAPYYDRLGFRRDGAGSYVLELPQGPSAVGPRR